jgi:hypothetical protein
MRSRPTLEQIERRASYLKRAAECERIAEKSADESAKAKVLEMAGEWRDLAEKALGR